MSRYFTFLSCALVVSGSVSLSAADEPGAKHTLRYKFQADETLRWQVTHRSNVRTTVSGSTQTAETTSQSVKVWRVKQVKPDGSVTFEQLVEDVDMRQQLSGHREVRYNSRKDKEPPHGFNNVAGAVGVPLALVTLDPLGRVLKREQKDVKATTRAEGDITVPLPEQPVAVGESWRHPNEVTATARDGRLVKVKIEQKFTLEEVRTGVARIRMETQILSPIRDPAVEAQVVQCATTGEIRFDIEAGRIRSQQTDVDRHVVGFRGDASSIHYATRFNEELVGKAETKVAAATGVTRPQ